LATVRVGLIGTGFGGTVQAPGFTCVDGAEVVAVASGRMERARAVAAEFGIAHAFDDYRTMLREVELDLVSITTPPGLHHEMTLAALGAGAHVLCEKPMARNVAEAKEMLAAAEQAGRVHAIDYEFRYVPARTGMKRLIDAGEVGTPFFVRIADLSIGPERPPWWYDAEQGGGLFQAIGTHYVDAVRWWIGPFARVTADVRPIVPEHRWLDGSGSVPVTSDDTSLIAFVLENGVHGRIDLSAVAHGGVRRIEVYGTAGTLVVEGTMLYRSHNGELVRVPPEDWDQGRLDDPRIGPFVELAQRVVDRIQRKAAAPFATFADGLEVQRVMDAIHRSSTEGRAVPIAEML
jgi:predicted dehydrogenase